MKQYTEDELKKIVQDWLDELREGQALDRSADNWTDTTERDTCNV